MEWEGKVAYVSTGQEASRWWVGLTKQLSFFILVSLPLQSMSQQPPSGTTNPFL